MFLCHVLIIQEKIGDEEKKSKKKYHSEKNWGKEKRWIQKMKKRQKKILWKNVKKKRECKKICKIIY